MFYLSPYGLNKFVNSTLANTGLNIDCIGFKF